MKSLSLKEIELMREVGRLSARILARLSALVAPGVKTSFLDQKAYQWTLEAGARPAPLNYKGYPKSICTSVNHCICHGLPGEYVLKEGDIVNIDVTCVKDGFHGDTSRTFYVGEVSQKAKSLTECAYQAMLKGIEQVRAGAWTGDIGFAVHKYVTRKGFYPVLEIGGHGIGREFHSAPFVPSFGKKGRGDLLLAGTCITVEPMINETSAGMTKHLIPDSEIEYYETEDKSLSAQFEHTVLVTEGGAEVLTLAEAPFKVGY